MEQTKAARWQDVIKFGETGPDPQTLMENERVRVIIAGVKPGQRIPAHPEAAAVYHFIEGHGTMIVDDQEYPIQPGTVISMDEGAKRGMVAETQIIFLAVRLARSSDR